MHRTLLLPLAAGCVLATPGAAQTPPPTARLLQLAQQRIAAAQLDSADVVLRAALESAAYQMDSVSVFVWRGILEHLRGSDSLAHLNFRQAVALNPAIRVAGLQDISPGLADIFDAEMRAVRIHHATDLEEQPAWRSGPAVVYPPELRRRGVGGRAVVRAVVDTLGHVDPRSIEVLETPDSALVEPLQEMMRAATFTPGRVGGRPVRSATSLALDLRPAPPARVLRPTQLVTAARAQLAARRPDSALTLLREALDPAAQASQGERVYALIVQGLAWTAAGRDSLATAAFDEGLAGYRDLTARGVDLAPFLRRLADSLRLGRRAAALAKPTAVGAVDDQPALVSHPPIRYAPEMQALRVGGTVIVEATLDTTGRVLPATVKIVQSPNSVFNAEARRVVLVAVYRPARAGGRAVRAVIRQPITFAPY